MTRLVAVGLIMLALGPFATASAQTAGTIAGTVRDTSGALLPGVTVEASSPSLIEKVRTAMTDASGQYKIVDLRPGVYDVTFSLAGFATVKREGIELTTGFTAAVNGELQIGDIKETITVSGQSPVVDIQNVSQQAVMTRDVIDAIPTGKTFAHLGALVPGMMTWGSARGGQDVGGASSADYQAMAIHGGRVFDQMLQVDGMPITIYEGDGGSTFLTYPDSNVEETTLQISAHSAEVETGGIRVNFVPRSGGNAFSGGLFVNYANEHLQSNNLTADLKARGLASASGVNYIYDVNPSIGGPLRRDAVWFFGGYRINRAVSYSSFYPDDHADWVYAPDTTRKPVPDDKEDWGASGRVTWQASPRNRIAVNLTYDRFCSCHVNMVGTTTEAASARGIFPGKLTMVTWSAPVTNRLLLEAGGGIALQSQTYVPQPGVVGPAAIEQSTGFQFRSRPGGAGNNSGYQTSWYGGYHSRASVSYVTGAHAVKVGTTIYYGTHETDYYTLADYNVTLLNAVPVQVTYLSTPFSTDDRFLKVGLFAQDQWTLKRMTLNMGLRFDSIDTGYPDYQMSATNLLPARSFPGADVLRWRDLSPRLGVSYDLFGDSRTALKASASRYVANEFTDLTKLGADPAFAAAGVLNRSWTDVNRDYVPQGDPLNPAANGELGPSTNANFGRPVFTTRYDPEWSQGGFGVRDFNWEISAGVQHELVPRVSVSAGYFRRIFGNFVVTDNLAVAPSDYDSYCISAPVDGRLPGGGGQRICGLYDIKPAKLGQVNNLRTLARNYGDQQETYNGLDLTLNARLPQGILLQGGMSTGKSLTDNCDVVDKLDNPSTLLCRRESPYLTQVKFLGSYTLPWNLQLAATYQDIPGTGTASPSGPSFGVVANYVATNAVIAPSLGRNLAAGGNVTVNIVEPGTMYVERVKQLDVRLTRTFARGGMRIRAMVDLYNALNSSAVNAWNNTYGTNGAAWLVPQRILTGRFAKFGAQINF